MGLVPASNEFLVTCRELCDKKWLHYDFDEVMTGFRASLKGASGILKPKLILSFGKVIVLVCLLVHLLIERNYGTFKHLKVQVYQAGTLSGNPVAMAAGLVSLRKLKSKSFYL